MGYGNSGTGTATPYTGPVTSVPTPRQPIIGEQMQRMGNNLETLHANLAELFARLDSILSPEPPSPLVSGSDKAPTLPVALGAGLDAFNGQIDYANMRLRSLIGRVEL